MMPDQIAIDGPPSEDHAVSLIDQFNRNAFQDEAERQRATELLRIYREDRDSRNEPYFPGNETRRLERVTKARRWFTGVENIEAQLTPQMREQFDSVATDGESRKSALIRSANTAWLAAQFGVPTSRIDQTTYANAVGMLAKKWELRDASDESLYGAIQSRVAREDTTAEIAGKAAKQAAVDAFNGLSPAESWSKWMQENPGFPAQSETVKAASQALFMSHRKWSERPDTLRALRVISGEIGKSGAMGSQEFNDALRLVAGLPEKNRAEAIALAVETAEPEADKRGLVAAGGEQFRRALVNAGTPIAANESADRLEDELDVLQSGKPVWRNPVVSSVTKQIEQADPLDTKAALREMASRPSFSNEKQFPEAVQLSQEEIFSETRRIKESLAMRDTERYLRFTSQRIDDLVNPKSWMPEWMQKNVYLSSADIAAMGVVSAATRGVGLIPMVEAYRYDEFRNAGMNHRDARSTAALVAPYEAALELVSLEGMGRMAPRMKRLFQVDPTKVMPGVKRLGLETAGELGLQVGIEDTQDANALLGREFVDALSDTAPNVDWNEALWSKDEDNPGILTLKRNARLSLSFLPFVLVGAASSAHTAYLSGQDLRNQRRIMANFGLTEEEIAGVLAEENPTKRAVLAANAIIDAVQAKSAMREGVETAPGQWAFPQDKAVDEDDAMAADRMPSIRKSANGWEVNFPEGDPTPPASFPTFGEAQRAAQGHALTVADRETEEFVKRFNAVAEPSIDEAAKYLLNTPGVTRPGEKILTGEEMPRTVAEAVEQDPLAASQLMNRLEITAAVQGLDEAPSPQTARIFGSNEATIRRMVFTDVSRIARSAPGEESATALDVFEEHSEGGIKSAIWNGEITPSQFVADVRRYEEKAREMRPGGDPILIGDDAEIIAAAEKWASGEDMRANTEGMQPLVEAFHALTHATLANGLEAAQMMPPTLKAMVRQLLEYFKHIVKRAALVRQYIKEHGGFSPETQRLLERNAGINDAEIQDAIMRQEMEAIAADALNQDDEILNAIAGKLPHPDTVTGPEAGEIRNIGDHFNRITRRKGRAGRRLVAMSGEGKNFFAPKGAEVDLDRLRASLNENHGFNFDTVSEMLDAVDLSLRGIPQYGTGEAVATMGQTFSIRSKDPRFVRLQAALDRLSAKPDERITLLEKLRYRLNGISETYAEARRASRQKSGPDREREGMRRTMAELEAIAATLPPEFRGRLGRFYKWAADYRSDRGQTRLVGRAMDEMGRILERAQAEAFRDKLDGIIESSDPKRTDSRNIRGKIGAEGHDYFARVKQAMAMTTADVETAQRDTEAAMMQARTVEEQVALANDHEILAVFGALDDEQNPASAARLAVAAETAQETYKAGRLSWQTVQEERAQQARQMIDRIKQATTTEPVTDSEIQAANKKREGALHWLSDLHFTSFASIYSVLERIGESTGATEVFREIGDIVRRLQNNAEDIERADKDRLREAYGKAFGTTNVFKIAAKLRKLHERTIKANLSKSRTTTERIRLDNAEDVIAGRTGREIYNDADRQAIEEAYREYLDEWKRRKDAGKTVREKTYLEWKRKRDEKAGSVEFSQMEAANLILLWRQQDLRPALEAHGYTESVIETLENQLSPEAATLTDWLGTQGDLDFPRVDKLHRKVYGVGLPQVRNHFSARFEHMDAAAEWNPVTGAGGEEGSRGMRAGALKHRIQHVSRPRRLSALAVWQGHRKEMAWWESHAEQFEVLRRVFRSKEVFDAIRAKVGDRLADAVISRLANIESNGIKANVGHLMLESALSGLRGAASAAILGLRLSTLAVQSTAALGSAMSARLSTAEILKGFADVIFHPGTIGEMWKSSTIRRRIELGSSTETRLAMSSYDAKPSVFAEMARIGTIPIVWSDAAFTSISAAAAYRAGLAQAERAGLTGEQAKAHAMDLMDAVVAETAQPANQLSRSEAENRWLQHPGLGLIWLFATEARQKMAMQIEAVRKIVTGKGRSTRAEQARILAVTLLVNAVCFGARQIVKELSTTEDEDNDLWKDPKAWANATLTGHLAGLPVIGRGLEWAVAMALSQKPPQNRAYLPTLDQYAQAWNSLDKAFDDDEKAGEGVKAAFASLKAAGMTHPSAAWIGQLANLGESLWGIGRSFNDEDRPQSDPDSDIMKRQREAQKARQDQRKRKVRELLPLTESQRLQALKAMAKTDRAMALDVRDALKAESMDDDAKAIAKFSVEGGFRAEAIFNRWKAMGADQRPQFLARLRRQGLLSDQVRAQLSKLAGKSGLTSQPKPGQ